VTNPRPPEVKEQNRKITALETQRYDIEYNQKKKDRKKKGHRRVV
jgi:hypothetical protein